MELFRYEEEDLLGDLDEIKQITGGVDFLDAACREIAAMLSDSKDSYLSFGPYWWSVKRIMRQFGYSLGSSQNEFLEGLYFCGSDELTMVAALRCRKKIGSEYLSGARDFALTDDGEEVLSLFDKDMECR